MEFMDQKNKAVETTTKKTKKKRKPNYILIVGIIVMMIPVIALGVILVSSLEERGVPVVENRFENSLNPAITDEMMTQINAISVPNAEKIEATLITGTLRISVDMNNDATWEQIYAANDDVVAQLNAIAPFDVYFTNHDGIKMYDVEIHTYNLIPSEGEETAQIYTIYTKTGGGEGVFNVVSSPKDEEVANELLNPTIPEVPAGE